MISSIGAMEWLLSRRCVAKLDFLLLYLNHGNAHRIFFLLFSNYSIDVFNILFMFVCLFSFFSILCVLCFCIVSPFAYSCVSIIFVQVYRPQPPGGNPIAVNKCHIVP
jgi:hypothetical protein